MFNTTRKLGLIIIGLAIAFPTLADVNATAVKAAVSNPARSSADQERDKTSRPELVLQFFGVQPGMQVLDLFSGGGYYSELLSYVVGPEGRVIAHTNKAYESLSGEEALARLKDKRLANVSRQITEIDNLGLEKASLDMVLMVLTYHDIYYTGDSWPKVDREKFFSQIRESLKPGGILAVVDHSAVVGTGSSAAQELHRIDEVFAKQDIESAGFVFDGASEALRNPDDARTIDVFNAAIRRNTDRFIYRFVKK